MTPLWQRSFSLAAEQHRSWAILQNTANKRPFLRGSRSQVLIFGYALFARLFGELLLGPKGSPGSAKPGVLSVYWPARLYFYSLSV